MELLWYLGGANLKVLRRTPSEHVRHFIYGALSLLMVTIYAVTLYYWLPLVYAPKIVPLVAIILWAVYLLCLLVVNRFVLAKIGFFNKQKTGLFFFGARVALSVVHAVLMFWFPITLLFAEFEIKIALGILVFILDFLPFVIKYLRTESPYDYMVEIENRKKKKDLEQKMESLKLDLDKIDRGEEIVGMVNEPDVDYNDYTSKLYIKRLIIKNIRSLKKLDLDFEVDGRFAKVIAFIGDNGVGKSTILRSIALGITDESGAVALMKNLDGPMIRNNEVKGKIELHLFDYDSKEEYIVTTEIKIDPNSKQEIIRKDSNTRDPKFLNKSIFICGYGSQRSLAGNKSITEYSAFEALKPIFVADEKLLNPETLLWRENLDLRERLITMINNIISDEQLGFALSLDREGLRINKNKASAASDGYKSTISWIMDLFGRAISYGMLREEEDLRGIVLIDELEQHLHPRWQRLIIQRLKTQFPNVQFIITTHTPLLITGVSDFNDGLIYNLEMDDGVIKAEVIKNSLIQDMDAGDVLQEAFHMPSTRSPEAIARIKRLAQLQSTDNRSGEEDEELNSLQNRFLKDNELDDLDDLKNNLRKY